MRFHLTTVILLSILTIQILAVLPEIVFAQPGLPGDPDQTPIDGGIGILAALGGAYAIKKLRDQE
jgi:hypothetical protein